jgi:hypothetical protein
MAGLVNFMGNKKPAGVRLQAEAWRVLLKTVYVASLAMVKRRMQRQMLEERRKIASITRLPPTGATAWWSP